MLSANPGTRGRCFRLPAACLAIVLAAVLDSGCIAPGLAPATTVSTDPSWTQQGLSEAPPGVETAGCSGGVVFEDEALLLAGERREREFALPGPCRLDGQLTLHHAAGSLALRVEGPRGVVFEENGTVIAGPVVSLSKGNRDVDPGPHPPGTYRYTITADALADFRFQVMAWP